MANKETPPSLLTPEPLASIDPRKLGTSFEDIKAEPVTWTWRPQVPRAKVTILESNPGDSKSVFTVDLAARISSGSPMPDGTPCMQGTVIMLNAEDGPADTVKPRLMAAGADCTRVIDFTTIIEGTRKRQVRLPEDVAHLRALVKKHKAVLVVIDPLWSFVGSKHSSISDQKMREALTPLKELAEELNVAIIIIRHLNKNTKETNPVLRGAGSIGITGLARNVLTTIRDAFNPQRYYLARVKANLAPSSHPLCFELVSTNVKTDTGIANVPKLEWLGTVDASIFELLSAQEVELTHKQKDIHKALPTVGGISAQQLAKNIGMERTTVTGHLKALTAKGAAVKIDVGRYARVTGTGFKIEPFPDTPNNPTNPTNLSGKSGLLALSDKSGLFDISDTNPSTTTATVPTSDDITVSTIIPDGALDGLDVDAYKRQKIAEALHEEKLKEPIDFEAPEHAWMKEAPGDDATGIEEN